MKGEREEGRDGLSMLVWRRAFLFLFSFSFYSSLAVFAFGKEAYSLAFFLYLMSALLGIFFCVEGDI